MFCLPEICAGGGAEEYPPPHVLPPSRYEAPIPRAEQRTSPDRTLSMEHLLTALLR